MRFTKLIPWFRVVCCFISGSIVNTSLFRFDNIFDESFTKSKSWLNSQCYFILCLLIIVLPIKADFMQWCYDFDHYLTFETPEKDTFTWRKPDDHLDNKWNRNSYSMVRMGLSLWETKSVWKWMMSFICLMVLFWAHIFFNLLARVLIGLSKSGDSC